MREECNDAALIYNNGRIGACCRHSLDLDLGCGIEGQIAFCLPVRNRLMIRQRQDLVVIGVRLCDSVQILLEARQNLNNKILIRCKALEACCVELYAHLLHEILVEDQLRLRPVERLTVIEEILDGDVRSSSGEVRPGVYQIHNMNSGVSEIRLRLDLQRDEVVTICAVEIFHVHYERIVDNQEDLVDKRCKLSCGMECRVPLLVGDRNGELPGDRLTIYALVNGGKIERIYACGCCAGYKVRPCMGWLNIRCLDGDEGSDRSERFGVLEEGILILRTIGSIGVPVADHDVQQGLCELLNAADDGSVVATVNDLFECHCGDVACAGGLSDRRVHECCNLIVV